MVFGAIWFDWLINEGVKFDNKLQHFTRLFIVIVEMIIGVNSVEILPC